MSKQIAKSTTGMGLNKGELGTILSILGRMPKVAEALVFGSRAKGNYKQSSDVDIALKGEHLDHRTVASIYDWLNEETLMPYHFDVLNYHRIDNHDLVEHIDRVGKLIYAA